MKLTIPIRNLVYTSIESIEIETKVFSFDTYNLS